MKRFDKGLLVVLIFLPAARRIKALDHRPIPLQTNRTQSPTQRPLDFRACPALQTATISIKVPTPSYRSRRNAKIKGYGGEALDWAIDLSFRHTNLDRIGIWAVEFNTRAATLYE